MTGAIVIFSILFPIVLMVGIIFFMLRSQKQGEELLRTGVPARGRVMQLGATGTTVAVMGHRHLKLSITAEVYPQAGHPYVATFEQLISELQIPSLQPGAQLELRIDPQNPQRMAIASIQPAQAAGFGQQQPQQQQQFGQQPQQFGQQQGAWGQAAPGGFAPAPMQMGAMTPNYRRAAPFMIFMMLITTVPIGLIMFFTFVDTSSMFGSSDSSSKSSSSDESDAEEEDAPKKSKKTSGGVCAKAAACCKVISGASAAACENYETAMMPVEGCKTALEGFQKGAKAMKKSCD